MEDDGFSGSIPESGAIFMSNTLTKKECFKRKIFGLPPSQADFVKQIKAGMILFLFEFKKRQLFGVYQASSNGAMDIVPHAFNYSGRRFPAQVRFTPLWYCDPLSEKHFRDAIIENYVSAKKFKFGLSEIQVRRLLDLFNSRKIKKEIIPHPLAEAVGVAGMDRRPVGGARFELSHRGYTEPTEIDVYNPAAFSDYHANSLVKEDEVFTDDRANSEGKAYALVQGDFEAKRRRLDNVGMLLADDMPKAYNNDIQTNRIDSPRDSLDEVRHLAAVRQLLAAERQRKENQVNKIRNAVRSSEYLMGPLDVRDTGDDDRFMQRNGFFDEYNRDGGFTREGYDNPFDRSKYVINDDKFLFDDYLHRNQNTRNIAEDMAYSDDNLSLSRQAMQVLEDRQYLMNKKEENKIRFDSDVSPFSAIGHNAGLLHDIRERDSFGRFLINDRINAEPNFGSCSVENPSLTNFSRPLHLGHRIIPDIKYPIVEGQVNENAVASSTRNAGYFESVGGQVADNGMFRKSEGIDNDKDFHSCIGPGSSFVPSSFSEERSARFLPEKCPQIFGPPHASFDDATIMRSTPYNPEHPKISHEFNVSMAANQNPTLVLENPHHGSTEDFYQYKNRSSSYILEPKKSSGSPDIAPEHRNKVLATNVSGHQGSLRGESTSSYLNSGASVHMDRNITPPVNDRGSLFSKPFLAQPAPDREYIERKFAHHSQSSGNHFSFDPNFPTQSQHMSKRVPRQEMDILAGKDFTCPEAKYSGFGTYHLERDLAGFGNQCIIGVSSKNVNFQANNESSGAPHFDSNVNKKSVFSRLASSKESQGGEERDGSGFDYMDATPDEVMDMLRQSNNLSPKKKSRAVGQPNHKSRAIKQPNHGESTFGEKHVQSHIENKISTMEKKTSKDAHLVVEESVDELPKETRIKDFKRRSYRNKNLTLASTDPSKCNKITGAAAEVEKSMKTTLKRKRLVRPVFGKTESTTNVTGVGQNSQPLVQTLKNNVNQDGEKSVSICEVDMTKENTKLVLSSHQSVDRNKKEQLSPDKQDNIKAHVLRSSNDEIKEDKITIAGIHDNSSQDLMEILSPYMGSNIKEHLSPEEQKSTKAHVLPSSNDEIKEDETAIVGINIESSQDLAGIHSPSMDSNMKEHLSPEEQKSTKADAMPFSSDEHKEHKTAFVGIHDDSSQDLMEIHSSSMDINIKEHLSLEEQKNTKVYVMPFSSNEINEDKTAIVGIHNDSSQDLMEIDSSLMDSNLKEQSSSEEEEKNTKVNVMPFSNNAHKEDKTDFVGIHVDSSQDPMGIQSPSMDINIKEQSSLEEEQKNTKANVMPFSSDEQKEDKTAIVGIHVNSPQDIVGINSSSMDSNIIEQSNLEEEQKNTKANVMPSSSNEVKEHKSSIVGITLYTSQALLTEVHSPSMGITLDSSQAPLTEVHSPSMDITLDSSHAPLTEILSPSMGITLDSSQALLTEIPSPSMGITLDSSQALLTEIHSPSMDITLDSSQAPLTEVHSPSMGITLDSSQALLTEIHSPSMGITVGSSQALLTEVHNPSMGITLDSSQVLLTEIHSPSMDITLDSSQALLTEVHSPSMDCNTKEHLIPKEQKDIVVHVSNEPKDHKTSIDGPQVLLHKQSMDCNIKERLSPEEQKDTDVHDFPSSSNEPIEHKTSTLDLHIDSSQSPQKGVDIQTSVEEILNRSIDSTAGDLNLEEPSSAVLEIKERRRKVVKRKREFINRLTKQARLHNGGRLL